MSQTIYQTILADLISPLWTAYCQRVPQALRIHQLLEGHNKRVVHDHIGLRTLNFPWSSSSALGEKLGQYGYCIRDRASDPEQHLEYFWFHHPAPEVPAILITELDIEALTKSSQMILRELASTTCHSTLWSLNQTPACKPALQPFEALLSESEIAAWFSLFGTSAHYFSVSVNQLDRQNDMSKLIKLLLEEGFTLDSQDRLIRKSDQTLLAQAITLPDQLEVNLGDQEKVRVSTGCYHFTLRSKSPSGKLYKKFFSSTAFSGTQCD
ncbi:DUF1338 domain-containing protein [Endozoicomonas montiporae]|uniref:DUF1338 domain-containing protein n=1 Tax=Endozoicomonas montiporae TaxID=1027273 RepID=UPI000B1FB7F3|nr:DUF1338 domain-containing protein [Endozoicomonas montiporae]